ncbi:MAG: phosphoribosylglycinamide formyltransferase [Ilumatobacteraceae bacterium]|nr:phosphoribosylglycinamide formyltransferase [Ilumatobacteraceae bacterium]
MTDRMRLLVMVSGNGTNLQAILDACADGWLTADVVGVISNKADVTALVRAAKAGVPTVVLMPRPEEDRRQYDRRLGDIARTFTPDLVVLAGFMRVLSMEFLAHYPQRVVNLHPALPGELVGTHAIERAFAESRDNWRTHSGVTVHLVPDEGVDTGPVLASAVVPIHADDTLESFTERMHQQEHELLVQTLGALCRQQTLQQPREVSQ